VTKDEMQEVVLRVLARIAPEADLAALDPRANLRDQLDIDSVDFLNFAIGLNKELGVDIPDADLPKLATLDGGVSYLRSRAKSRG
jgi:acyl carrier protein